MHIPPATAANPCSGTASASTATTAMRARCKTIAEHCTAQRLECLQGQGMPQEALRGRNQAEAIDTHAHVIAEDKVRYPPAPLGGQQSGWSREHPVDVGGMVAAMDEAGIARCVLV